MDIGQSLHLTDPTCIIPTYDSLRRLASQVVAFHFCDQGDIVTCQLPDFVHSIAAQMCAAPFLQAYKVHNFS